MKPEFKVTVHHKGVECSFNGNLLQKAEMFPPIISAWLPAKECESVTFKTGRKEWLLTIERVRKGAKHGRS